MIGSEIFKPFNYLIGERHINDKGSIKKAFPDYIVNKKGQLIIIKVNILRGFYEYTMIVFGIWLIIYIVLEITLLNLRFSKPLLGSPVYLISLVAAILLMKFYVIRFFQMSVFIIDQKNKELKANYDKFQTKLYDIKEMSILEELYQKGDIEIAQYRLKFILSDGEKTSVFAFTSYNELQKIIEIIKNSY